jgi:hypothetical protein
MVERRQNISPQFWGAPAVKKLGVFAHHLLEGTGAMRSSQRQQVRRNIDLLATIRESGPSVSKSPKSFGNIIELGSQAMILETKRDLRVGLSITVNVVFPGQQRGDDPFAHLHCKVHKVHDDSKLQYELTIVDMDTSTRDRLNIYLAQSGIGRGT